MESDLSFVAYYGQTKPLALSTILVAVCDIVRTEMANNVIDLYDVRQMHASLAMTSEAVLENSVLSSPERVVQRVATAVRSATRDLSIGVHFGGTLTVPATVAERPDASSTARLNRGFFAKDGSLVLIGWPAIDGVATTEVADLRGGLQSEGLYYKYAGSQPETCNDVHVTVGKYSPEITPDDVLAGLEDAVRGYLARTSAVCVPLTGKELGIAIVKDKKLPWPQTAYYPIKSYPDRADYAA